MTELPALRMKNTKEYILTNVLKREDKAFLPSESQRIMEMEIGCFLELQKGHLTKTKTVWSVQRKMIELFILEMESSVKMTNGRPTPLKSAKAHSCNV